MLKFSAPMPYTIEYINKILDINKQIKKSKITSLYASLPSTCNLFSGFEQKRNIYLKQTDFNYWKFLMCYSIEKGMEFIYLLNNPASFDLSSPDFIKKIEKLDKLLCELKKIGITKLRAASAPLISYLCKNYSQFDIYASTSFEFKTISEYQNFFMFHPNVKQIVPSHDINKNFRLLKNLKKDYPQTEIEIMVNEGCMQGCPNRNLHSNLNIDFNVTYKDDLCLSNKYCMTYCNNVMKILPFHSLTLNNNIYPWEIEKYSKIGINNFKLVGRDMFTFKIENYLNEYLLYLKCIDDYKISDNISIVSFIHHLSEQTELKGLKTAEIKKYLPNINHFIKYGHLCASICGVDCRYCYKCAEKIQKVFFTKQEEERKRHISVCFINNI